MAAGDCLLLMTDGAFELHDPNGEQFGVDRLKRLIQENCHRTAKEIVDIIRETITAYDPDNLPPDDITLLILKRNEA